MDLNIVWFGLFGVLIIGYAILDGFDMGVGMLALFARNDHERRLHMNAIGPVWDGNEVWLLTGGGALFAAFPGAYATVFSGFYLALILLLVALIARAVSFEFRSKVADPRWRSGWDWAFGLGSFVPALLYGVAMGNVMRGIPMDADTNYTGTFFDLLNPFALVMGLLAVAMFLTHGALWMVGKTEGELQQRMVAWARRAWVAWVALFVLGSVAAAVLAPGIFHSGLGRPLVWLVLVLFATGLALQPLMLKAGRYLAAFLGSCLAVAAQVLLAGFSLFPNIVPALGDFNGGLTIYNAASTQLTLTVMLVIALVGMPIVIAYTAYIYRVFKGKVVLDDHSY